jgi:hypothetical protein
MFAREKIRDLFGRLSTSAIRRRDVPIKSAKDAIGWWETRRRPFNLIVGSAGILTCIVVSVVALGDYSLFDGEFGFPDSPLFAVAGIVLYGVFANVCFSISWLAELIVRKIRPGEADRFSTVSLSRGLIFSVLLTLSPAIVIGSAGIFGLIGHFFRVAHTHRS